MIIETIRRLMQQNNVNTSELSRSIGVSYSTLASQLKGQVDENNISVSTIIKIADFFGVSVEYILGIKKVTSPQKQRLIRNYDGLNTDGQTKLVDYSDDLINSGNYRGDSKKSAAPDDLVDIKIAAKGGGVEGRQITREQAEKVKKMLDEIELKDHTGL